VKEKLFAVLGDGIALIAALSFVVSVPAFAQSWREKAVSPFAVTAAGPQLPTGAKLVAQVRLDGRPVTHMYTQSEYGRRYLYIGDGQYSFTAVDISEGQNPQVVNHTPGNVDPALYEHLFTGGSVDVSPSWEIITGVDNQGGTGMRGVLDASDSNDAQLLRAFGSEYANLADRDRRLVYFASPSQLLIVQDNRITEIDFIANGAIPFY